MNLIELAEITDNTNVELDLEDLSSILARGPGDGTPAFSANDAIIEIHTFGQTGTVALEEDLTGGEDDARAYTQAVDREGNNVTTGALTTETNVFKFQVKMARFINISTDVSAGSCKVFALLD